MAKVAWIGLGVMGFPMAGYLLTKGGHDVTVYNRNGAKAEAWTAKYGGQSAATPAEAALAAEYVFCCVGNDDDLRAVSTGPEGAFRGMGAGAVFIDHTTASAHAARELFATASDRGIAFLDAPVSGGQSGAENGALTVMVGGEEEAFARAKPLIDCYARAVNHIGPSGAGQLAKMVNQIAIAGLLQGLSEAIAFAETAGLNLDVVMETISKGAAQSWQMDNRWRTMHEGKFDFGFAVDWMRKDLGMCLDEAKRNGAQLPVTALVDGYYGHVQSNGGGRWDTSSLITLLKPHTPKSDD
ncbi:NAD(P)-dependent oxidoreductase [Hyphomicrobium sulfonivorans]|uniref:NAD(P)-dependent oxidoreductase n=1 Tax=Hyphomicrobium sulfonivorans TaxID=121290 RepID=UPI00156EACC4|nr:NAD(P)-dependent oxidoreductase [Hyphomicrobium sulfonivorans]MBI1650682.1 NAD(P)-dependent oxidoreductase [Hyphomicrobium sulfonivorans]NSL71960.1 oxidoreductase [Hyphomicrobium sulfonivorans]